MPAHKIFSRITPQCVSSVPQQKPAKAEEVVVGAGFEPAKLSRQIYSLIPLAAREPHRRGAYYQNPRYACQLLFLIYYQLSWKVRQEAEIEGEMDQIMIRIGRYRAAAVRLSELQLRP